MAGSQLRSSYTAATQQLHSSYAAATQQLRSSYTAASQQREPKAHVRLLPRLLRLLGCSACSGRRRLIGEKSPVTMRSLDIHFCESRLFGLICATQIRLYDTLPDTSRQRPASTVAGSDCGGRRLSFSSFSTSEMTPSEAPSQGGYQGVKSRQASYAASVTFSDGPSQGGYQGVKSRQASYSASAAEGEGEGEGTPLLPTSSSSQHTHG
eukprot:328471-Prorocentrum_minimum.AAC.4